MMKNWEFRTATLSVATVLFVLILSALPAMAQLTTGTLAGEVTDPQGKVVANATVKVKNEGTGVEITTTTNGDGIYNVSGLVPGAYSVTTSAGGFKKSVRTGIQVSGGVTTPSDIKLEIGSADVTVTVTAGSDEVLQTEQSQVSTTLSTRQVADLPSNGAGGGIDTLALLIPGVVANRVGGTNTNGTGLSVNGNRGRSNNFQIDGSDNNDLSVGGPALFVDFQDAVQEFQVITNNFSAQYGRNQGAIVNIISKSGTNDFHGSAFIYHQDNVTFNSLRNTEARTTPQTPLSPNLYTVYGGTVGGPIYLPTIGDNGPWLTRMRDKAFFFLAYQGIRNPALATGASTNLGILANQFGTLQAAFPGNAVINTLATFGPWSVPGAALNSINSPTTAVVGTQFNLLATGTCPKFLAVGVTPPAGCVGYTTPINPSTGAAFLTGGPYDVLNFGTPAAPLLVQAAQYQRTLSAAYKEDYWNLRIDVRPTNKDSVNWRFLKQSGNSINGNGTFSNATTVDVPAHSKNSGGEWSHTYSNTLINSLRVSYNLIGVEFGGNSFCGGAQGNRSPGCVPRPGDLGIALTNIAFAGSLGITKTNVLSPLGPATNLPQGRIGKVYQLADTMTKIWGRHAITFGGEFKYLDTFVPFLPTFNGAYTFNTTCGAAACAPLATRIINNAPSAESLAIGNPLIDFLERDIYGFVQDDFKLRPNLTLNLGVRYEYTGQPLNQLNKITTARETSSGPLYNPAVPLASRVVPAVPVDKNNFAPRIGFAYTPHFWKKLFGEDQTVFRGGFSIAYDAAFYNILLNVNTTAPAAATLTIPSGSLPTTGSAASMPNNPFGDNVRAAASASGLLPRGILNPTFLARTFDAPDFRAPYSKQFSFNMQRQFGRKHIAQIGYVGTQGRSLFQTTNDNYFIQNLVNGFVSGGVTYPGFPGVVPSGQVPVGPCSGIVTVGFDSTAACTGRQSNSGTIRTRRNTGSSDYHSFQASYHGRFYRDSLSLGASYTFSKTMDNVSEVFAFADIASPFAQNPFCISTCERGLSNLDRPHAFSMSWVYDVPFYKEQRGLVGRALGGWQVNGTYILTSGAAFTPNNQFNCNFGTGSTYFDCTSPVNGGDRPFIGSLAAPQTAVGITQLDANKIFGIPCNPAPCTIGSTGLYSLNAINVNGTSAAGVPVTANDVRFIVNGPGAAVLFGTPFGNMPRNSLRGPIFNTMNLSIFKTTKIRERIMAQFRVEAFNVLNHPNPGNGTGSGGTLPVIALFNAGVLNSAFAENKDIAYARRVIQLGIRLVF